jgi:hypothetical protein
MIFYISDIYSYLFTSLYNSNTLLNYIHLQTLSTLTSSSPAIYNNNSNPDLNKLFEVETKDIVLLILLTDFIFMNYCKYQFKCFSIGNTIGVLK